MSNKKVRLPADQKSAGIALIPPQGFSTSGHSQKAVPEKDTITEQLLELTGLIELH
jgi:hypothetical protein